MLKIPRFLAKNLALQLKESTKALILYGPRQAGKMTLGMEPSGTGTTGKRGLTGE